MQIDELPIEILMQIFGYSSRNGEFLLVNKLFYGVASKLNDRNLFVKLDERLFENSWLPSIEKSTRQISKLHIHYRYSSEATRRAIISIVAKFGAFIKSLKITYTLITLSEFKEILSLVPNVEHLVVKRLHIPDGRVCKRLRISRGDDLNLHKLKTLEFDCGEILEKYEYLSVFDRLPVGVLTDLTLASFELIDVAFLLERQSNITKLDMTNYNTSGSYPVQMFDNMQLQSLKLQSVYRPDEMLLSKQTQLKTLSIEFEDTNENFLNFIARNATKLETLSINIGTAPSPSCIANIGELKSLKNLSVKLNKRMAPEEMESLATYSNFRITSLFFNDMRYLTVNIVRTLAKSLTELKHLKFWRKNKFFVIINSEEIINAIMTNFNFVETLHIWGSTIDRGHYQLNGGNCFNPKLTEFLSPMQENKSETYISKLIADYPNLKRLRINCDSITSYGFRQVLKGFTNLESLVLFYCASRLTVDDLNYLVVHKNNLEFVCLGGIKVLLTDELKRHLSTAFGVIIHCPLQFLTMAVDSYTMYRQGWYSCIR